MHFGVLKFRNTPVAAPSGCLNLHLLLVLLVSAFLLVAPTLSTANPSAPENGGAFNFEGPLPNPNGTTDHLSASVFQLPTERYGTLEEIAAKIRADIQRQFPNAPLDNVSFGDDPRNTAFTQDELQELARLVAQGSDAQVFGGQFDLQTAVDSAKPVKKSLLKRMFSLNNISWGVFRLFSGGASTYLGTNSAILPLSVMMTDLSSVWPMVLAAGAVSASFQITNILYMDWASKDRVTDAVQARLGTTPIRSFSINALSILFKWGLVLEGIYLASIEFARQFTPIGSSGFDVTNVGIGVVLTTATQGVGEIAIHKWRTHKAAKILESCKPEELNKNGEPIKGTACDRAIDSVNKAANFLVAMNSFVVVCAAVALLSENPALAYTLYGALGAVTHTAYLNTHKSWILKAVEFYSPKWGETFLVGKLLKKVGQWASKTEGAKSSTLHPEVQYLVDAMERLDARQAASEARAKSPCSEALKVKRGA